VTKINRNVQKTFFYIYVSHQFCCWSVAMVQWQTCLDVIWSCRGTTTRASTAATATLTRTVTQETRCEVWLNTVTSSTTLGRLLATTSIRASVSCSLALRSASPRSWRRFSSPSSPASSRPVADDVAASGARRPSALTPPGATRRPPGPRVARCRCCRRATGTSIRSSAVPPTTTTCRRPVCRSAEQRPPSSQCHQPGRTVVPAVSRLAVRAGKLIQSRILHSLSVVLVQPRRV